MKRDRSILDSLREQGYRLTPQRMMVVEAIEESHDHISAEEIHAKARTKYPYLNISTVYRTLELLKEKSLVAETDLGGGRFLYHPVGKAQHHHLICRKCGKVADIDINMLDKIREELKAEYDFDAELEHIAIFGTCKDCLSLP
ncbi:Fur family transcriptional regulator [Chloroflexota bacterium]